jgi:hypothetical protein
MCGITPARQYRQSVARLTRINAWTSEEVIIGSIVESFAFIALGVVWCLAMKVDTEIVVCPRIMGRNLNLFIPPYLALTLSTPIRETLKRNPPMRGAGERKSLQPDDRAFLL